MDLKRYLDLFTQETREHLQGAESRLLELESGRDPALQVRELFRHFHSIKGMAMAMGFPAMARLAHAAEDVLEGLRTDPRRPEPRVFDPLLASVSCLGRMLQALERELPCDDPELEALVDRLAVRGATPPPPPPSESPAHHAPCGRWRIALSPCTEAPLPALRAAAALGLIGRLGRVIDSDPPMALLRTGRCGDSLHVVFESALPPAAILSALGELEGVSPGELLHDSSAPKPSRARPSRAWVRVRADLLAELADQIQDLLFDLGRCRIASRNGAMPPLDGERLGSRVRRLESVLSGLRSVPFESTALRLQRAVAEVARRRNRSIRLEVTGRSLSVERSIVEAITDPLLHLVRNAADHGIEDPPERLALGKPPEGRIEVGIRLDRERVRILIRDDGRGIDTALLRRRAVAQGEMSAEEAEALDEATTLERLTRPGYSTATGSDSISGRGVGLDVVLEAMERVGGRLHIETVPLGGTTFTLDLPFRNGWVEALVLRCGEELYALPVSRVNRVLSLEGAAGLPRFRLLDAQSPTAVVQLGAPGDQAWGLEVDEVLDRRPITIQPLPPPFDAQRAFAGGTLLEDGRVVLLLEPDALRC